MTDQSKTASQSETSRTFQKNRSRNQSEYSPNNNSQKLKRDTIQTCNLPYRINKKKLTAITSIGRIRQTIKNIRLRKNVRKHYGWLQGDLKLLDQEQCKEDAIKAPKKQSGSFPEQTNCAGRKLQILTGKS